MKYKCLVLDHDDTIVNSTATIHYPAFIESLKILRPHLTLTLEEYFYYNFEPGFSAFCHDVLHLTQEEIEFQTQNWLTSVDQNIPLVYEGIKEILWDFKNAGGYICVVSHSMKENIIRDYKSNHLPMPDLVFGWEQPAQHRKPSPWPLEKIKEEFQLSSRDMVMIDDLKPGKIMAELVGVDFIGAGWAHEIEPIRHYMQEACLYYCKNVNELKKILFEDE